MTFAMGIIKDWHALNALEIVRHPWFCSAFLSGGLAQLIKFLVGWWRTRRPDFDHLSGAGGMPSAHSAMVTGLAVAVGLTEGFDAPIAMISVGFAVITLADAVTLRRSAGEHAALLNRLVEHLNENERRFEAKRLRERLGHRRREALAGVAVGMAVALAVCAFWDFWK